MFYKILKKFLTWFPQLFKTQSVIKIYSIRYVSVIWYIFNPVVEKETRNGKPYMTE